MKRKMEQEKDKLKSIKDKVAYVSTYKYTLDTLHAIESFQSHSEYTGRTLLALANNNNALLAAK